MPAHHIASVKDTKAQEMGHILVNNNNLIINHWVVLFICLFNICLFLYIIVYFIIDDICCN